MSNTGKRSSTARIKRIVQIALEKAKGMRRLCAGKLKRLSFFWYIISQMEHQILPEGVLGWKTEERLEEAMKKIIVLY